MLRMSGIDHDHGCGIMTLIQFDKFKIRDGLRREGSSTRVRARKMDIRYSYLWKALVVGLCGGLMVLILHAILWRG